MSLTGSAVQREIQDAERRGARAERVRARRALEAEMDGPGIDWSDVEQVEAMISRVCPPEPG